MTLCVHHNWLKIRPVPLLITVILSMAYFFGYGSIVVWIFSPLEQPDPPLIAYIVAYLPLPILGYYCRHTCAEWIGTLALIDLIYFVIVYYAILKDRYPGQDYFYELWPATLYSFMFVFLFSMVFLGSKAPFILYRIVMNFRGRRGFCP